MTDMAHITANEPPAGNVSYALWIRREELRFERTWPPMGPSSHSPVVFSWEQLERQLTALAATPAQAAMCRDLVSGVRKQAPGKPSEMILREVLCLAGVIMDETFRPEFGQTEFGEAEMS